MTSKLRIAVSAPVTTLALALSACGGSGTTSTPTPTPANSAPLFTSAASAAFPENTTGLAYTIAVSDADGDQITLTITGGADASNFTISGTSINFTETADFEMPSDANRDNVHELTIRAQDGNGGSTQLDLMLSVTNEKEGISVRRIAILAGEGRALGSTDDGSVIAFMADGRALRVDGETGAVSSNLQMFDVPNTRLITGTNAFKGSGFTQGPYAIGQLPSGELVATFYEESADRIRSRIFTTPTNALIKASIVNIDDNNNFHVAVGVDQDGNAQDPNSPFGKLYLLTADPFSGASIAVSLRLSRIGVGIRQPGGADKIDQEQPGGGDPFILLADQGANLQHEINLYPSGIRPLDFGWPNREGNEPLVTDPPQSAPNPSVTYEVGDGPFQGQGVVLGSTYAGTVAELQDRYIFGDVDGSIYAILQDVLTAGAHTSSVLEDRTADFQPDAGAIDSPVAFARNGDGTMFFLDSDGELFRVDAR